MSLVCESEPGSFEVHMFLFNIIIQSLWLQGTLQPKICSTWNLDIVISTCSLRFTKSKQVKNHIQQLYVILPNSYIKLFRINSQLAIIQNFSHVHHLIVVHGYTRYYLLLQMYSTYLLPSHDHFLSTVNIWLAM